MQKIRFSIAGLMGVTLVAGVGFAALRTVSEAWAGLMLMLTCGALMLGVVGSLCRGTHERAWWLGFTLFGGGYLVLAHSTAGSPKQLPTITLAEFIGSGLGAKLVAQNWGPDGWNSLVPTYRILHCLWTFTLALLGCVVAGLLIAVAPVPLASPDAGTHLVERSSRIHWKPPMLIGLGGFWILVLAATLMRWPGPGLWAGGSFFVVVRVARPGGPRRRL